MIALYTYITLSVLNLIAAAAFHGEAKEGEHRFEVTLIKTVFHFGFLYWIVTTI